MAQAEHRAPPGTFVVGEGHYAFNEWAQVGEPHPTLAAAREMADSLNRGHPPDLEYFVYDENGLVLQDQAAA